MTETAYIRRHLLPEMEGHLDRREISLLTGPRQSGKTTLMRRLEAHLKAQGRNTLWLNLDFEDDARHLSSQGTFLQKIRLELGSDGGVVFIDEIQRKQDAGLFLKGLYDQDLPWKFVATGSGSLELKEKISESLAGRKRQFELRTVSFAEFVDFQTGYRYTDQLPEFFAAESAKAGRLLLEYLQYGGYPKVILADSHDEKLAAINEIYRSYLERDIVFLLRVEKSEAFTNLVRMLAAHSGKLVILSELAASLGLSLATVKTYLWYLEKTFIVRKVTPYFTNIRKEITKSPMVYFADLGLRNFACGHFGKMLDVDAGFVFQTMVHGLLWGRFPTADTSIHYWRTKDKAEVDFVVRRGDRVVPLEVNYRALRKPEIQRSFRSFIERYAPKTGLLINLGLSAALTIGNTQVQCLPYWEIMFEDWLERDPVTS
jgi:uncharacterized protein